MNFITWRFYSEYYNRLLLIFVSLECEAVAMTQNQTVHPRSTAWIQNSESVEMRSGNSPMPPPRQRHNPFNKVQQTVSLDGHGHQYRSPRYGSAFNRPDGTSKPTENIPRTKVTFRELHTAYGRRVLSDFNAWRHAKRQEEEKKQESGAMQELLITL